MCLAIFDWQILQLRLSLVSLQLPPPPSQALWLYQFKIKSSLICTKRMACMWHASLPIINHTEHKQTFQSINRRSVRYKWQTVNEMKWKFHFEYEFGNRFSARIMGRRGGRGSSGQTWLIPAALDAATLRQFVAANISIGATRRIRNVQQHLAMRLQGSRSVPRIFVYLMNT